MIRIDLIGNFIQTPNVDYGRGFCANLTAATRTGADVDNVTPVQLSDMT
jgi:hypothetical protein